MARPSRRSGWTAGAWRGSSGDAAEGGRKLPHMGAETPLGERLPNMGERLPDLPPQSTPPVPTLAQSEAEAYDHLRRAQAEKPMQRRRRVCPRLAGTPGEAGG